MPKAPYALCSECPLQKEPFVPCETHPGATFAVVGEAPGYQEIAAQKLFVGDAGKILDALCKHAGVSRDTLHLTNAILCKTPYNRAPTKQELTCCRGRLLYELGGLSVKRVLALGLSATHSLSGNFNVSLKSLRGAYSLIKEIPGLYFLPTYRPVAALRNVRWFPILKRDMERFFRRAPVLTVPEISYTFLKGIAMLEEMDKQETPAWVFDVETDSLEWYKGRMLCIGLGPVDSDEIFIVPENLLYQPRSRAFLKTFFSKHQFIGHNAKFDAHFIEAWLGVRADVCDDTMLMSYVLDEQGVHGLKELTLDYFGVEYESALKAHLPRFQSAKYGPVPTYRDVPSEILQEYLARDIDFTRKLYHLQRTQLQKAHLWERPYKTPVMCIAKVITEIENNGLCMDHERLETLDTELDAAVVAFTADLRRIANKPDLNPNSHPQIREVFKERGIHPGQRTKGNKLSTAADVLKKYQENTPEIFISTLLQYRRVKKIKSSYTAPLLEAVQSDRVYPTYLLHRTVTGRLSAVDPAVMTLARPEDYWTESLRKCIKAPPGKSFIYCDYSQAEYRVIAQISGDTNMIQAYRDGSDLHSRAAAAFFGEDYTKADRSLTKRFNFGFWYGGGLNTIATQIGLPKNAAQELMARYTKIFPQAIAFRDGQLEIARKQGYVEEPYFLRRRRFPLLTHDNLDDVRKQAANHKPQSLASDLTAMAAYEMMQQEPPEAWELKLVLFMHDAVGVECATAYTAEVAAWMIKVMEETPKTWIPDLQVPFKAEADIGEYWQ